MRRAVRKIFAAIAASWPDIWLSQHTIGLKLFFGINLIHKSEMKIVRRDVRSNNKIRFFGYKGKTMLSLLELVVMDEMKPNAIIGLELIV